MRRNRQVSALTAALATGAIVLSAGIGFTISERASLTVLPFVGLTQASPKFGLTIGISSDMMRR
jgi:uncharacterized membrane protein YczE